MSSAIAKLPATILAVVCAALDAGSHSRFRRTASWVAAVAQLPQASPAHLDFRVSTAVVPPPLSPPKTSVLDPASEAAVRAVADLQVARVGTMRPRRLTLRFDSDWSVLPHEFVVAVARLPGAAHLRVLELLLVASASTASATATAVDGASENDVDDPLDAGAGPGATTVNDAGSMLALRRLPALETFRQLVSPMTDVGLYGWQPALVCLELHSINLDECAGMPVTLRELRLNQISYTPRKDRDDENWRAWLERLDLMAGLTRLELGRNQPRSSTADVLAYSLQRIARSSPKMRVLSLPACEPLASLVTLPALESLSIAWHTPEPVPRLVLDYDLEEAQRVFEVNRRQRAHRVLTAYEHVLAIGSLRDLRLRSATTYVSAGAQEWEVSSQDLVGSATACDALKRPISVTNLCGIRVTGTGNLGRLCATAFARSLTSLDLTVARIISLGALAQIGRLATLKITGLVYNRLRPSDNTSGRPLADMWPPLPQLRRLETRRLLAADEFAQIARHYSAATCVNLEPLPPSAALEEATDGGARMSVLDYLLAQ
jgi:hypothetical protein